VASQSLGGEHAHTGDTAVSGVLLLRGLWQMPLFPSTRDARGTDYQRRDIERKRFLTMTELNKNPILNERVKPAMLNPLVKHITPSADIKWVLLCFGITLAIFAMAYI